MNVASISAIAEREFLAAHPHCHECGEPATGVEHVIPRCEDMRLFWNRAYWRSLCTACLDTWSRREATL